MTSNKIALAAILLWLLTIGMLAFRFFAGQTEMADDGRKAVIMTHAERNLVLTEMRQLLSSVQGVLNGINQKNNEMIVTAAKAGGTGMMADMNPGLMMKLPLHFKKSGVAVHERFDKIAEAASNGKSEKEILNMLSEQVSACVACHANYQIKGE